MSYTSKQLAKADKYIGTRCKIYYPWEMKMIHRVVHKDYEGYYIYYEGKKRRLRIAVSEFGDFLRFEMLHGRR